MSFLNMAISKPLLVTSLIMISIPLLHEAVEADETTDQINTNNNSPDNTYYVATKDCGGACAVRCRLASREKICLRACGTCCARCNCVPPGTSGNQALCPCYYNITTHNGRRKCP